MQKNNINSYIKKAFTLIELLVVIAIIGILSGMIVVSMSGVTQKANIAKAQIFSNSLRNVLMIDLISEWKLDDGSGTQAITKDSWSGGNNGTLNGFEFNTTTSGWRTDSQCVSGNCLQFDGSNDYISTNYNANLNPQKTITIEAWVKPSEITTQHPIVGIWGTTNLSYMIDISGSVFEGYIRNGGSNRIISSSTIKTGTWYHVALTYNGGEPSLYLNGVSGGTLSGSAVTSMTLGTDPVLIGKKGDSNVVWFNGNIDGVRIYNAVVPTSKIQEQYYLGLNKLLANKGINQKEYQQRIAEIVNITSQSK
ncbi:MAG: LamG-like jellyroll fold domain-containing protein [Candidatus Paceibacterota bacterium]|jgi:prepilin-type N-terminal cleavage/methylation domain-containing protein